MVDTEASLDEAKRIEIQDRIPGISFVVLLSILTLMQGGFYAEAYCAIGIAIVVVAIIAYVIAHRRNAILHVPLIAILFLGIAASALIGGWLAGMNASFIIESSIWPFAAAVALLSAFIFKETRDRVFDLVGWVGVFSACIAILMFAGILPFEGAENVGRLQFTFQYANAAGIWFAVMAILAITSSAKRLRIFGFFPLIALLLTQSVGAAVVFAIACVVVLIRWGRKGAAARAWALLMQLICVLIAGGLQIAVVGDPLLSPITAIAGFALLVLLRRFLGPVLEDLQISRVMFLSVSLGLLILGIIACVVMLAFTGRAPQATQTFIERILQSQDALELLTQNLIFGTGPGSWSYLYREVQSVQYTAAIVHNGYAQIALDSGVIGLALFLGVAVKGFRSLRKAHDRRSMLLAAMMLLHFLIDFDLQFASLLMLFVLFIVPSQGGEDRSGLKNKLALISVILVSALCLLGCCLGLWAQMQKNELYAHAEDRDWPLVEQRLENDELLARDPDMRALYLQTLINQEEYAKAATTYYSWPNTSANEATLAAYALYQADRSLEAEEVIVDKLLQQPKNIDFFNDAAEILVSHDASSFAIERYSEAAALANQSVHGLGSYMTNQKDVPGTLSEWIEANPPSAE